jgi:hypothetical protein
MEATHDEEETLDDSSEQMGAAPYLFQPTKVQGSQQRSETSATKHLFPTDRSDRVGSNEW